MKAKFYSLAAAIALLFSTTISHAQVVVVQHGSSASVFSNLDSAMTAASAGDYLYLSGGLFIVHGIWGSGGDSIHFYKPLHIVGAGINADSTSVTGITIIQAAITSSNFGQILIGSGADGSTFDGLFFNAQNVAFGNGNTQPDSAGHFIFSRCQFNAVVCSALGGGPNATNLNFEFHECIMNGLSEAGQGNCTATMDRCIISGECQSLSAAVTWTNCIMGGVTGTGTINNCFVYSGVTSWVNEFSAIYNNCLIVGAHPGAGSDIFNNCAFGANDTTVFVNVLSSAFSWSNDYHMAAGSPGINYGNDGHDIGIYGTATPAKPGFVPYNPHYTGATIPASTDANGNLNIDIHVAAQPY